jgi:hypothetical protein
MAVGFTWSLIEVDSLRRSAGWRSPALCRKRQQYPFEAMPHQYVLYGLP